MENHVRRVDNVIYGPKVDISIDNKGLGRTIFEKMQTYKNRIFQVDVISNQQETYKQVNQKCTRTALHMRDRGVKPRDVILVCSGNSLDALIPIYGTLYLNSITVTLDPSISSRDSIHLLQSVSPKVIFVVANALELIENAVAQLVIKPEVVVMGMHKHYSMLFDFLKPHPDEATFVPDYVEDMNDTTVIFFSSGVTGLPKGICCSHASALRSGYYHSMDITDSSTSLLYTSFYWISALFITLSTILVGGKRLVAVEFTPETFLEYVRKYGVTFSLLSATYAMQFNEENTKGYKKESLEEIRIGGNAIAPERLQQLRKYLPDTAIYTTYGQTEGGGIVATFSKSSHSLAMNKTASCGLPFINVELKIVDVETAETLGPNRRGEICIKSSTLFSGYYNRVPEVSIFDDGFFKTGDVGYYDEDNCIYISDRLKEMFKYRSWHIVPASVEKVLYQHPAVEQAIVIGIPHEPDDNHPIALVVLKNGYDVTEKELLDFVNGKVLDREQLRAGLKIVKKFPITCTGKLARQTIRQMVLEGNINKLNEQ